MHPLDAFGLDGFRMVASRAWTVRLPLDRVWQRTVADEEPADVPDGMTHLVIERFAPGEHRCSMIGTWAGRPVCARGFRRLYAHSEVLEVHSYPTGDHLLRTTYTPMHFGRTRVDAYAGHRAHGRSSPDEAVADTAGWADMLRRCEARDTARVALQRHERLRT